MNSAREMPASPAGSTSVYFWSWRTVLDCVSVVATSRLAKPATSVIIMIARIIEPSSLRRSRQRFIAHPHSGIECDRSAAFPAALRDDDVHHGDLRRRG